MIMDNFLYFNINKIFKVHGQIKQQKKRSSMAK